MSLRRTFFGTRGRLRRLAFLGYSIVPMVGSLIASGLQRTGLEGMNTDQPWGIAMVATAFVLGLVCPWSSAALVVRRLHDMDYTGWVALLILGFVLAGEAASAALPEGKTLFGGLGFGIGVWLMIGRGSDGPNRFGAPPASTGGGADQGEGQPDPKRPGTLNLAP